MVIMAITNVSHVREDKGKVEKGSNPYLASNLPPLVDIDSPIFFYDTDCSLDYCKKTCQVFSSYCDMQTRRSLMDQENAILRRDETKDLPYVAIDARRSFIAGIN